MLTYPFAQSWQKHNYPGGFCARHAGQVGFVVSDVVAAAAAVIAPGGDEGDDVGFGVVELLAAVYGNDGVLFHKAPSLRKIEISQGKMTAIGPCLFILPLKAS